MPDRKGNGRLSGRTPSPPRDVEARVRTMLRVLACLCSARPVHEIVRKMAQSLCTLIPCDRFSLGLPVSNRWYYWEDDPIPTGERQGETVGKW